jgi:hemolysin activation/secretion protein
MRMRSPVTFSLAVILACGVIAAHAQCGDVLGQEPEFTIHAVRLKGVERLSSMDRDTVVNSVLGKCFGDVGELSEVIRDALQRAGFFTAKVSESRLEWIDRSGLVDVEADVDPGRKYILKQLSFSGAKAFPPTQLRPLVPMNAGDIFDIQKIRDGIRALLDLYQEHGYINFIPVPQTQIDEDAGTINLLIDIDEGAQFKVAKVAIVAPEDIADRLYAAWPLKPGAIYNPKEMERFFAETKVLLPPHWSPDEHVEISPNGVAKTLSIRMFVCPPEMFCPERREDY